MPGYVCIEVCNAILEMVTNGEMEKDLHSGRAIESQILNQLRIHFISPVGMETVKITLLRHSLSTRVDAYLTYQKHYLAPYYIIGW